MVLTSVLVVAREIFPLTPSICPDGATAHATAVLPETSPVKVQLALTNTSLFAGRVMACGEAAHGVVVPGVAVFTLIAAVGKVSVPVFAPPPTTRFHADPDHTRHSIVSVSKINYPKTGPTGRVEDVQIVYRARSDKSPVTLDSGISAPLDAE